MFKAQRQIDEADLPAPEAKLALLALAIEKLGAAGYEYIGMDHFALPGDELARARAHGGLHRNFMGYTTHADTDLLGLGVSSISRIADSFSQNPRDLPSWEAAIDAGRLPVWRGLELSTEDLLRAEVIQQLMCQGEIDVGLIEERFGIDFRQHFGAEIARLAPLQADGLVELAPGRIAATARGRLLLRIIAMCFDAYLDQPADAPPRFSRAI
jgi:oxygen-independent coproporphyrinogen-3 oxidase